MPLGRDQFGPTDPGGYECPVCGIPDEDAFLRCNDPRCLDGRDQRRFAVYRETWPIPEDEPAFSWSSWAKGIIGGSLITAAIFWALNHWG